jgi:hypothetical protein
LDEYAKQLQDNGILLKQNWALEKPPMPLPKLSISPMLNWWLWVHTVIRD